MNMNWLDNKWVLRVISLFFAIMIFVAIRTETGANSSRVLIQQSASVDTTETIANVPVRLGVHDDDVFVSQLPESVTVTLTGPKNIVTQLTNNSFQVQTEDLTGAETGEKTVRLVVTGLPEGVSYEVKPSRTVIQISRKKTVTIPIEYEMHADTLASNVELKSVQLSATEVALTGREATIDKVARAYIQITSDTPRDKSFDAQYKLQVVDKEGNLLDVNASITEVEAKVTLVGQQSKTVELAVAPSGENSAYQYRYQLAEGSQLTVQGPASTVEALRTIRVLVDVTEVRSSTNVTGRLELPEGVTTQSGNTVTVTVGVEPVVSQESSSAAQSEASSSEVPATSSSGETSGTTDATQQAESASN